MKPTDFPPIPGITNTTEIYTQRRDTSEAPANYKFTALTFFNWIKVKLGFDLVLEFTAQTEWLLEHNMGRIPIFKSIDTAGNILFGLEEYIDDDNYKITFSTPRSGKVLLR